MERGKRELMEERKEASERLEKNIWKLHSDAIEGVQKRMDSFDAEIERLVHGLQNYEAKSRGDLMLLKQKVTTASRRSNLNLNILHRFHKEMWFWSIVMAVVTGFAFGALLVLLAKINVL